MELNTLVKIRFFDLQINYVLVWGLDINIRPRTHRHDEKVERNYRNYNERFYRHLSFYSYENLTYQMNRFFYKSNRLPM